MFLLKDMYGFINASNPTAATEKFIAESTFAEMDEVSEYCTSFRYRVCE